MVFKLWLYMLPNCQLNVRAESCTFIYPRVKAISPFLLFSRHYGRVLPKQESKWCKRRTTLNSVTRRCNKGWGRTPRRRALCQALAWVQKGGRGESYLEGVSRKIVELLQYLRCFSVQRRCISLLGLAQQSTKDWMAETKQKCIFLKLWKLEV